MCPVKRNKSQSDSYPSPATGQVNILWTGLENNSKENCLVKFNSNGADISSTIIGVNNKEIYRVEYRILTNHYWETIFFEIKFEHQNDKQVINFKGDGQGQWWNNGIKEDQFEGCIDIDLPLTPFTNTLPIRRLNLKPQQTQEIKLIYCDLMERQIKPVRQKYTCLSNSEYKYENVPNDFEATIQVDKFGLVINYPKLFTRIPTPKGSL